MNRVIMACALLFASLAGAQEITIAAAADLNFALRDLAQKYEAKTGTRVKLTFGSSGNLFTAIENGAPYDLFFSADVEYPKRLAAAGRALPETIYEYAVGKLVLWAPKTSPLDVSHGFQVLMDGRVRKIAMANPKHAPYGRAAEQALRSAGVYDLVRNRLVLGENISQTAQFVQSGNADVGLLALSLALSPTMAGKYWVMPEKFYEPLRQAAIVVKSSSKQQAAREFLNFIQSEESREVLNRYGFGAAR